MTMSVAQPDGRFGAVDIGNEDRVLAFNEKPKGDGSWINAGYFVCQPEVLDFINDGDDVIFEQEPLKSLAKAEEVFAYRHEGFWMPMDTLRDKIKLNDLYSNNQAPWKVWNV